MKKIIPIIITIIVCIYLFVYTIMTISAANQNQPLLLNFSLMILGLITLGVMIAMIVALFSRLKEIKEEEKDDISKY